MTSSAKIGLNSRTNKVNRIHITVIPYYYYHIIILENLLFTLSSVIIQGIYVTMGWYIDRSLLIVIWIQLSVFKDYRPTNFKKNWIINDREMDELAFSSSTPL